MHRRLTRPLVFALVAAQLLLSAPIAGALVSPSAASQAAHCADMVPADDTRPCPCCPEGADMAACQATCAATPGATQTQFVQRLSAPIAGFAADSVLRPTHLAEPPLKPPPIV